MQQFETDYLKRYTPCTVTKTEDLAEALGIVHVELILIHPFREGNGRLARLLANLMILQANRPPLDFSSIEPSANFDQYINAIQAGLNDYTPIKQLFKSLIQESSKL